MMLKMSLFALIANRTGCFAEAVEGLVSAIRAKYDSTSALCCIMRHPRLAASLGTVLLVLERFGLATQQEREVVYAALSTNGA